MWDTINSNKNGELVTVAMIFIDEKFIKPTVIDSRLNIDKVLSDVTDCLYGIGEMENPESKWKKGTFKILLIIPPASEEYQSLRSDDSAGTAFTSGILDNLNLDRSTPNTYRSRPAPIPFEVVWGIHSQKVPSSQMK
ncbi:putative E3 ubiquitin-protein ligase rhb1a [Datura stramonium]|uniref:E3 ubiquitin-protein ligase rhb1a n=1 Tax=Datura stramonium TaxID=4076 RepID=A0ABS8RZI8_DATST|nr:putative E3 ubiquitin-protein ligase rhb1a [Datura stramonium]